MIKTIVLGASLAIVAAASAGAADLPVHLVAVTDVEHALVVRLGHFIRLDHACSCLAEDLTIHFWL